jgi:DNA-binding NarL/FixJ family response regulator
MFCCWSRGEIWRGSGYHPRSAFESADGEKSIDRDDPGRRRVLQYVRAGISGFLWREMSGNDVLAAIRAVKKGEAVCPGALCTALFQYFERESSALPCAGVQQRLGFTRREQQLIPLIAKGLTNKEIANHFCLSEQTVKNHLYRMKHKFGAEDRLSIVQRYRTQGFLL